jgi:hypothetical protein
MMSSYLADQYGFTTSQETYSALLLVFVIFYFFSCGMCSVFTVENQIVDEQDIEAVSGLLKQTDIEEIKHAESSEKLMDTSSTRKMKQSAVQQDSEK